LEPGDGQPFTAELRAANGTLLTGRTVTWMSSDPSVFALNATTGASVSGMAVADGASTITATAEGVSGSAMLTVRTPVASVVVTPATVNLAPGDPQAFS